MILRSWRRIWDRSAVRTVVVCGLLAAALLGALVAAGNPTARPSVLIILTTIGILAGAMVALSHRDAVSMLTLVLVPLLLVPENYVLVGPLRSIGNLSILAGLGCLLVWGVARWTGVIRPVRSHPFRWTVLVFVVANLAGFAAALTRTLVVAESDSATRTIFPLLAMLGIAMLAADGLTSIEQITRLMKRLVVLCSVQAGIGIAEFFTGLDYRSVARLPGLTVNVEVDVQSRGGFDRVGGAANHPIEFSVALAAVVPLALHFALNSETRRARRVWWTCLGLLLLAIPLTVSRSGLLGIAVGLVVYGAILHGRARANLVVGGLAGLLMFPAIAPGVLGTMRSFFLAGANDNSITGRLDDYALIPGLMEGRWWFGRGFGTFQPAVYFILDNQYLMTLLCCGFVGLGALVALVLVGAGVARGARKRFVSRKDGDLAQAVAAGILCLGITAATFDLFSFLQTAFVLFLFCGVAAALWSIATTSEPRRSTEATEGVDPHGRSGADVVAVLSHPRGTEFG